MRTIVAFTGLAGAGKSTAAQVLIDRYGFARVRFAGPLKAMMAALGLSEREIDGDLKEVPCELLGWKTPRYAMQTIGTEWGRDLIGSDIWVRAWKRAVDALPAGQSVVVDDCRLPNEAQIVIDSGGVIIHIDRDGVGTGAAGHSSEAQALPAHWTIRNDHASPEAFAAVISGKWRDWSWAAAAVRKSAYSGSTNRDPEMCIVIQPCASA
jgi:hypothetical protein